LQHFLFEIPSQVTPLPPKPQLPAILCSPAACTRLEKKSEPLAEQIVERGLAFDREKLEGLLSETLGEIERRDKQLPGGCEKTANGLLKHYARGRRRHRLKTSGNLPESSHPSDLIVAPTSFLDQPAGGPDRLRV
jgi:hypothetical protein